MKKLTVIFLAGVLSFIFSGTVAARDVYVHGYYRSNGTYVAPYHRTSPDSNRWNNYSTRGNVNPYTGQTGRVDPYYRFPSDYGRSPYNNTLPRDPFGTLDPGSDLFSQ